MATERHAALRRCALQDICGLVAATNAPLSLAGPGRLLQEMGRSAGRIALAATWEEDGSYFVGLLAPVGGSIVALCRHRVPTRAHGLAVEPGGTILVAARRPGDWLMRFDPHGGRVRNWCWTDGEHSFNGHVVRSGDGRRLFTTETSLENGEGSVGVRDSRSLALLARWPTAGLDPHELVLGPDGGLWIANGGLETRQETGRTRHHRDRMDSSLVRLEANRGRVTGQWRLDDRRLSLRHVAVTGDGTLAVALQAEHDDPEVRQSAPVLALWDRRQGLRTIALPPGKRLAGYGGSVAASGDGIAVSCPRAGCVASWRLAADEGVRWQAPLPLPEACAVAGGWIGGAGSVIRSGVARGTGVEGEPTLDRWQLADIRLDNHWALTQAVRPAATPAYAASG